MIEDDTHDKLVKAYLDYFRLNEEFQQRPAETRRRLVRKKLSAIQKLCKIRRDEIMEEHIRHVQDGRARNNPKEARKANPKNN